MLPDQLGTSVSSRSIVPERNLRAAIPAFFVGPSKLPYRVLHQHTRQYDGLRSRLCRRSSQLIMTAYTH